VALRVRPLLGGEETSAVCCLLPAACCLLPAACCLLPAACCLMPDFYCLLSAPCCLLPIVCCPLSVFYACACCWVRSRLQRSVLSATCILLSALYSLLSGVCSLLFAVRCLYSARVSTAGQGRNVGGHSSTLLSPLCSPLLKSLLFLLPSPLC
jgi:hypothetical protein